VVAAGLRCSRAAARAGNTALLATVAVAGFAAVSGAATLHVPGMENRIAQADTDARKVTGTVAVSGIDSKTPGQPTTPYIRLRLNGTARGERAG